MRKKIFKINFSFLFIISLLIILSSCGGSALDAPSSLKINEGVLSWTAVEDAEEYIIFINETEYTTSQTSYDLSKLSLTEGSYQVKVKAVTTENKKTNSAFSLEVTYIVHQSILKLSAPNNVRVESNTIKWSGVANATSYDVKVGTVTKTVSTTSIDLSEFGTLEGTIVIMVKAVGQGIYLSSDFSSAINHRLELSSEGLKEAIVNYLIAIHECSQSEAEEMADERLEFLFEMNEWAELDNNGLYDFYLLVEGMEEYESFDQFFEQIIETDYNHDQLANIIRAFIITMLYYQTYDNTEYYQSEVDYYENLLESVLDELNNLKQLVETTLESYRLTNLYALKEEQKQIFDENLLIEQSIFERLYQLGDYSYHYIYHDYRYYLSIDRIDEVQRFEDENPWLLEFKEDVLLIFSLQKDIDELGLQIQNASEDEKQLESNYLIALDNLDYFEDSNSHLIYDYESNIRFFEEMILNTRINNKMYTNISTYLKENKTLVLDGLVPLIKFTRYSYENLIEIIMNLMTNENLTPSEIVVIRNEFVETIFESDQLPTKEEFEKMLSLIKEIGLIIIDAYEEFEEELYLGFFLDLKESMPALVSYLSEVYLPYLNILKEFLLSATIEDFELLMDSPDQVDVINLMMSLSQKLEDNVVYQTNIEIINNLTKDLILSGDIKILPLLISNIFRMPIDLSKDLYSIITNDPTLILEVIDEITAIINDSLVVLFYKGFDNEFDNEEILLDIINLDFLKTLTTEDIDALTIIFKKFLIKTYLYASLTEDNLTMTEAELEEALNSLDIQEALSKSLNIIGEYLAIVKDFKDQGLLTHYDYQVIIDIAKAINQLNNDNESKINRIFELVRVITDNQFFIDLSLSSDDIDYIEQNINQLFNDALICSKYDYQTLTEQQKEELKRFIDDVPLIGDIINREYNNHLDEVLGIDLFKKTFDNFVEEGKICSNISSDDTFSVQEIFDIVGWENVVVENSDWYTSFFLYINYGEIQYKIMGQVGQNYIFDLYWIEVPFTE